MKPFKGPIIPCGSLVEYYTHFCEIPVATAISSAQKSSQVYSLGYALHAGGIWKGDMLVADIEEVEKMDASEINAKRLNAKEVLTPKKMMNISYS